MVQTDSQTGKSTRASAPKFPLTDFAEMSKQRLDATIAAQNELLDKLKEMNDAWLARVQSEAELGSELTNKLLAARSLPDAAAAWQEWATRRMNLLAEDGRRIVADGQKVVEASARLWSNGWSGAGSM
jgi:hypothetical protein